MQDEIVYNSGNIVISKTLARFGGITYPINGIGSVYVQKPDRAGLIVFGLILIALGLWLANDVNSRIAGFVCAGIGVLIVLAAMGKPHKLMLRTASGDQQAYESTRKRELHEIKAAIEQAVVLRG